MKRMNQILPLLPPCYTQRLRHAAWENIFEFRLHVGQPLRVLCKDGEKLLHPSLGQAQLEEVLRSACRQSVYAFSDTMQHGYVTIEGGHRIGICGFGVVRDGRIHTLRSPSSLSIRLAHSVAGCADKLFSAVKSSALILGPPGSGKTTLLRDAVLQLSDLGGQRVSLVDERGELSACVSGVPQLQIGCRTDVMVNVQKAEAIMMLLRTMNPQWIAVDEITAAEDIAALEQASYCGVHLLATAHGASAADLYRRPLYGRLMKLALFDYLVLLRDDKTYTVEEIGK